MMLISVLVTVMIFSPVFDTTLLSDSLIYDEVRITGLVVTDDGDPLTGVQVFVENSRYGTVSDANGRFTLEATITPSDQLIFNLTGFQTVRMSYHDVMSQLDNLVVRMTGIEFMGDDVFITASRFSRLTGSVPVSFRSIEAREIQTRNNSRLDEALRYVPGLSLAENQVSIRGSTGFAYGTGSRVLMLVDGSPIMGPDTNDIRFTALPMSQIQRIEIIKGPGSALYGSGALGGVINLITQPIRNSTQTSIRTFAGVHEPTTNILWKRNWDKAGDWKPYGGVEVGHSTKLSPKLGFRVNGLYLGDAGYLENSRGYALQAYTKLIWSPSSDIELDLQTVFRHYRNQIFLYWNGRNDALRYGRVNIPRGPGNEDLVANGKSYTTGQQITFLPSFRHVINDQFFYTVRGRAYALRSQPLFSDGTPQPEEKVIYGVRYGGEVQTTWLPGFTESSLITGISADGIVTDGEMYIGLDNQSVRNQPEYAFFSQFEFTPVSGALISAGLRYDVYQIDTQDMATKLSPKLNVSYNVLPYLTVRAAYGQGFRVPAISERFVNSSDYLPLEPNLNLRPEESTGTEFGLRFQFIRNNSIRLDADFVGFNNEYKNLIEPRFVPQLVAFQFINLNAASVRGFETTFDLRTASDRLSSTLGYTYLDHKDSATDGPLAYRSDHQMVFSLYLRIWKGLSLGTDFQYLSKPEKVDTDFSRFVSDASVSEPKQILDLRAQYDLSSVFFGRNSTKSASGSVIVRNALNHFYVERPAILGKPRTYELSFQVAL
jgi:outer membrane receptor for ferrienterochelin and colicins